MNQSAVLCILVASSLSAAPALSAPIEQNLPRLVVIGRGSVKTAPAVAALSFRIKGEGLSSDAAATELVRKRIAIADGISKLLGNTALMNVGELSIVEVRDKSCDADDDSNRPRLSSGSCQVRGYIAEVSASLRVDPVGDAGTALGLAVRLGASDAHVNEFSLRDPAEARQRAETAAVADAKARATAIAAASGMHLGVLLSVEDQAAGSDDQMNDIIVTARRKNDVPPPAVVAPIIIELKPEPIETSASMVVSYRIVA